MLRIFIFAGLLVGCAQSRLPDARRPVVFVAEGYSAAQRQELVAAAQSWNLAFGTQLTLDESRVADLGAQVMSIGRSASACGDWAAVTIAEDPSIQICDETSLAEDLFVVARHEMGHALRLIHANDPVAVMAPRRGDPFPRFSHEDRQLFATANPHFRPARECGRINTPALTGHGVRLATLDDGSLWLVRALGASVIVEALDGAGQSVAPTRGLPVGAIPQRLRATARGDRLDLAWVAGGTLHFSSFAPADSATASVQRLHGVALPRDLADLEDVSAIAFAGSIYVATSFWVERDGDRSRRIELHRIALDTGAAAPFDAPSFGGQVQRIPGEAPSAPRYFGILHARFVVAGRQLLLVLVDANGFAIHRVGPGGKSTALRAITASPATLLHQWRRIDRDEAVLAWHAANGTLQLQRLRLDAELSLGRRAEVALPNASGPNASGPNASGASGASTQFGDLSLAVAGDQLGIVTWGGEDVGSQAIFFAAVERSTLALTASGGDGATEERPWRRVSAPDRLPVAAPSVAARRDQFVLAWSRWLSNDVAEVRTRCVAAP